MSVNTDPMAALYQRIKDLEAKIPKLNVDLAQASMHAYDGEVAKMKLTAQIAQLTAQLAEWQADAERLAKDYYQEFFYDADKCYCKFCDVESFTPEEIQHSPDCPITLHRQLVAKYGTENNQANVYVV